MTNTVNDVLVSRGLNGLPPRRSQIANRKSQIRAFTLIELLLVLVILGVLAALVIPKFTGRSKQARETAAKTDLRTISTAIDAFETDNSRFPNTEEGLNALVTAPSGVTNWRGPYLKGGVPKDPWGNVYQYRQPGQQNTSDYDVYSFGPDGREGTDDIGNWESAAAPQ